MRDRKGIARLSLVSAVASVVAMAGCAARTPERAASRFVYELRKGTARLEGSPAFERERARLDLKEREPKQTNGAVARRSASWSKGKEQIALVTSNVRRDPPERFDLRLAWAPARPLRAGLMEGLLGAPFGTSATWDEAWVIGGGVLEYRAAGTETPYLLFSSPAYIRDPLDFVEAANLPHMPSLASVRAYLERSGRLRSPARVEDSGLELVGFSLARGVSVGVYSGLGPRKDPYLAGLAISVPDENGAADFVRVLGELGIVVPERALAEPFGAIGNFALARSGSTLMVWRRIESPRAWCGHLRPDLERCSATGQ